METHLKDYPNIDKEFWEQVIRDITEINGK